MGEMKPTPGPWVVNHAGSASAGKPFHITEFYVYSPGVQDDTAICSDVIDPVTQEPSEVNARLIAEAGTVFHNTGLSPVQLVEQRDELMAACKKLVEWEAREKDHAIGFMERINLCETAFQMMYAALAKCEGVKP